MRNINLFVTVFLVSFIFQFEALSKEKKTDEMYKIYDEKNYAGPMGMGLKKTIKKKNKLICYYNTVNGYEKLILENDDNCPKKISE